MKYLLVITMSNVVLTHQLWLKKVSAELSKVPLMWNFVVKLLIFKVHLPLEDQVSCRKMILSSNFLFFFLFKRNIVDFIVTFLKRLKPGPSKWIHHKYFRISESLVKIIRMNTEFHQWIFTGSIVFYCCIYFGGDWAW